MNASIQVLFTADHYANNLIQCRSYSFQCIYTVHPRLSEHAELNLKTGRSDMPKIRIIENHHQNELIV